MKKILLSLVALVAMVANAQTVVTFDPAETAWTSEAGAQTETKNGITMEVSQGLCNGHFRYYKSQVAKFTSTIGNITKIEFTCTAENDTKYGPGCFTVTDGTYTYEGAVGTWVGSSAVVELTASSNQVRATKVVVTVGESTGPAPTAIAVPTISVATGTYTEAQSVTVTAPEGYGVIYTLDGSTPADGNGTYVTAGTATFTVDKTTTVKAISVDNSDPDNCSKVSTSTITIIEPAQKCNIADAHKAGKDANVSINATVVATAAQGFVIGDGTGYLYTYKSNHGLKVGDIVTATGVLSEYGGFVQLPNTTETVVAGSAEVNYPQPEVLDGAALDAWVAAPVQKYVQIKGKLTISGNYYNIAVDGAATAIGALVKPNDAILGKLASDIDVTVTGYAMYVASSKYAYIVATDVATDVVLPTLSPITLAEFTNGGFESWTEGTADQWTPNAKTANATVEKSTTTHSGAASICIKGATSNTRLASTEIALPAGWYTYTAYAQGAEQSDSAQVRIGYATVSLNEAHTAYNSLSGNDYHYVSDATKAGAGSWVEVKETFELKEDCIICIIVMNPKNSGAVLVDDIEFRAATAEEIEAAGIHEIAAEGMNTARVAKLIENGKLVIRKGNLKYSVAGVQR